MSTESEGGDRTAQSLKGLLALGPASIRLALGPQQPQVGRGETKDARGS